MNLPADFTRLTAENPADPEKKFSIRFIPPSPDRNPNPPRVVLDAPEAAPALPPVAVPFLTPVSGKAPARKTHRMIQHGDGSRTLETTGYGGADGTAKALRFTHCTRQVADIEDLHTVLRFHSDQNCLAVRGQVRPDAARVIFRRLAEEGADILDGGSRLVVIDLDHEVAPVGLDTDDDLAVVEFLRSRLPPELRDVSCVVQFSNSYGLWRLDAGRKKELKAHVWILNDEPLTGVELRRWIAAQNRIGDYGQLDPMVSNANQAIYCASPVFEGCTDPVRQRLFLLLSDTGRDTASIRPPAAPEPIVYAPGAVGERCPDKLRPLVAAIQRAVAEGLERHPVINAAAFTAGRLVRGGAFTAEEARAALMPAAMDSGSAGADRTVNDGLLAGMTRGAPILVGAERVDEPDLPPAFQYPVTQDVTLDVAESRIAALVADVIANPRNATGKLRIAVINSTVGCGKTHLAIEAIKAQQAPVLWFAAGHGKQAETETAFNADAPRTGLNQFLPLPAKAILGRGAVKDGNPICMKPDALKAVKEAGLAMHTKKLLCISEGSQCAHFSSCNYYRQMRNASPTRILTHDYLTLPLAEAVRFESAIAVIDENPINRTLLSAPVTWADSENKKYRPIATWLKTPVTRAVYGAIMDGIDLPPDEVERLKTACQAEIEAFDNETPPVAPWQDDQSTVATIGRWQPQADSAVLGVLLTCSRYLRGEVNTLWKGTVDGKPALFSRYAKLPHTLKDKAVLLLDATANETLYRAAFEGLHDDNGVATHAVEIHHITVANAPGTQVIQVKDQTFYKKKLIEDLPGQKMQARMAGFIALAGGNESIVNRDGLNQSPVGFIGNKAFVEKVSAKVKCEKLHFNNLVGMNSLQDCPVGILAGRTEPKALDAESVARALWPREPLNCTGSLERQRGVYQMADGTTRPAVVKGHADPRVDAVLRSIRDAELTQSVGRFRLTRMGGKTIFVFGSTPIPGLIVDRLATTDELLPDWRLAEALLAGHGTALLGANWLAETCPDAFPSIKAADHWITYFKPPNPGKSTNYPEMGVSKLKEVTYFLAGQRGGKGRRAITKALNLEAAAAAIEVLIGIPTRRIFWTDTEAPEAPPATVTAPIETAAPPPAPPVENPAMPELNPSTDTLVTTPPGVGNILWMIGSAFDPDWDRTDEVRSVTWQVTMIDGNTCTLRTPECPGYAEAHGIAQRMMPSMHHIAAPRAYV